MLSIKKISLVQFRNYSQQTFVFNKRIVGITGHNGSGKTNLLDAIYYLCFTRSYFTGSDQQNIQYQTNGFRLEGDLEKNGRLGKIVCTLKDGKKEVGLNEEKYDRFSRHIGQFPAVVIAPDDAKIILGGSDERRKWLDSLLSQLYPDYLEHLIIYHKILLQRNSLLKNIVISGQDPDNLLDIFDLQLIAHGVPVYKTRSTFLADFIPQVQKLYDYIAGKHEVVDIQYQCTLQQAHYATQLKDSRYKDMQLQRTSTGIHRDDLLFLLDGHPMKTCASQGQRKSFLFALKLAQFEIIRQNKNFAPLLLLDDVFEKLDQERVDRLISLVAGDTFGQVFITDTHPARLLQAFEKTTESIQLINI